MDESVAVVADIRASRGPCEDRWQEETCGRAFRRGQETTAINIFEGLGNAVKKREILCTSAFEL